MKPFLLICLLASASVWAQAETTGPSLIPLANAGIAYPTGFEATVGVMFAMVTDTARGPSVSVRADGFGPRWGLSAGPGWVEEIDWGGYGANLWLSQDFLNGAPGGNALGLEAYVRLLVLEFRVGLRGSFGGKDQSGFAVLPVAGVNFGL